MGQEGNEIETDAMARKGKSIAGLARDPSTAVSYRTSRSIVKDNELVAMSLY